MAQISISVYGMGKVRRDCLRCSAHNPRLGSERYCFRKQASLIVLPERPAIEKPKAEYTVVYMAELINRPEFIVRVLGIPIPIPISLHVLC